MDDNQEVTRQSGLSRLCSSIICAVCVAPIVVIIAVFVLGWNEQRAVCEARAIDEGSENVEEIGCDSATAGNEALVLFSCDLSSAGLTPLSAPGSDFSLSYTGTGLSITAEMYQCVEHSSSSTTKDSVGGGTKTVTTYTYSKEWRSSQVSSSSFNAKDSDEYRNNCDVNNPSWPTWLPDNGVQYAPSVDVGAFTIDSDYVAQIPLTASVFASSTPSGWSLNGDYYESSKARQGNENIGMVRVSFKGTDWSSRTVTVLGENKGGAISRWSASDSWGCSDFGLAELRMGTVDKDVFFEDLQAESNAITTVLRIVGFIVIWVAFSRVCGPLEVAADCIPCIGPYIGNFIDGVLCCISCPPACGCALGVIGIVWVAMRPQFGIPLMIIFFCTCCGSIGYVVYSKTMKKGGDDSGAGDGGEMVGNAEEA